METDTRVVEDERHGTVTVVLETGRRVVVSGDAIPQARIDRTALKDPAGHVPVGTRRPEELTMTVGDVPAVLIPSRGRLSRKSYRVDVELGGVRYRFEPTTPTNSVLVRDGTRLGDLSRADGELPAEWEPDEDVTATDVAVGHAVAAAFGTGADSFFAAVIDLVEAAVPG